MYLVFVVFDYRHEFDSTCNLPHMYLTIHVSRRSKAIRHRSQDVCHSRYGIFHR